MPRMLAPAIERKDFASLETKVVDSEKGIVEALVAVTGNTDDGNDVIQPGAFVFTRQPKIVRSHNLDELVAKVTAYEELKPNDPRLPADLKSSGFGALKFTMAFDLEDDESRRAFRKVVFHDDLGWSIGYTVPPGGQKKLPDGRRSLTKVNVWEASLVTFGMNAEARTVSVKSAAGRQLDDLGLDDEQKAAVSELLALAGEPEVDETKTWPPLADSFEETSERARQAIEGWAEGQYGERGEGNYWWVSIDGTFDAYVVATVEPPGELRSSWRFPYVASDDGIELGEPEAVTVRTVVAARSTEEETMGAEITDEEKALLIEHLGEEKAGRVLSSANRAKIREALSAIQAVLSSAGGEDDDDETEGKVAQLDEPEVDEDEVETLTEADVVAMLAAAGPIG